MAPRQRNVSASTTPATSEDEASNSSDDASAKLLLNDERAKPSMKTRKSTEATVPSQISEADIARDYHDYFNIVALAVVVFACSMNYQFPSFSYTGNHFWTMWAVSSSSRDFVTPWVLFNRKIILSCITPDLSARSILCV